MQDDLEQQWQEWKAELEETWRGIPKGYRSDRSVLKTLQCRLYGMMRSWRLPVVADYMPPRAHERGVDIIALGPDGGILYAVCFDPMVTLAAVKSLTSFESVHKIIITTGPLEKKVKESRFFLKPEVHHIHLKPFDKEG